jgi:hypothetical protein
MIEVCLCDGATEKGLQKKIKIYIKKKTDIYRER